MAGAGGAGLELNAAACRVGVIYFLVDVHYITIFLCNTHLVAADCCRDCRIQSVAFRGCSCAHAVSPTGKGSGRCISTAVMSSTRRSKSRVREYTVGQTCALVR